MFIFQDDTSVRPLLTLGTQVLFMPSFLGASLALPDTMVQGEPADPAGHQ